jgi:tetratricopeptide (TPR) repeat protein
MVAADHLSGIIRRQKMKLSIFKAFGILTVLALILPGLLWSATARKDIKKTAAVVDKKTEAAPSAAGDQKPATGARGPLDERWVKENQQIMELVKEKKLDEGIKVGLATLDYLKEAKLLDGQEAATTYNNVGMLYLMKGQFADSQVNLAKALNLRTRIFGDTSIEVATVWLNFSELYKKQAQYIFQLNQKKADDLKKATEGAAPEKKP